MCILLQILWQLNKGFIKLWYFMTFIFLFLFLGKKIMLYSALCLLLDILWLVYRFSESIMIQWFQRLLEIYRKKLTFYTSFILCNVINPEIKKKDYSSSLFSTSFLFNIFIMKIKIKKHKEIMLFIDYIFFFWITFPSISFNINSLSSIIK